MNTWEVEQAQRVGRTVKRLRGKRSAQWLAERSDEIGLPMTRQTITDLENGRRRYVSTAELSVLAWALSVSPVQLLFPDIPDGPVQMLPNMTCPSIVATTWFSGETSFPEEIVKRADSEDDAQWLRTATYAARLIDLSRERLRVKTQIESFSKLVADYRGTENDSLADTFVDEVAKLIERKKAIERQLREIEGAVVSDGG